MLLPFLSMNLSFLISVAAAVIPAIILMRYIYKQDTVEKEPKKLLISLILLGVLSGLMAMILETVGTNLLNVLGLDPEGGFYNILMAFLVVAVSEEFAKYILTKLRTWRNPAFNYRFDAVVYCVFTSLGFAAFENILYVVQLGLSVAIPRALLSIPGHMAFAVVMGVFYGRAKLCEKYNDKKGVKSNLWMAFIGAVAMHGFYDACLMVGTGLSMILFVAFVIFMYAFIFRLIKNESRTDEPVVDQPVPLDQLAAGLPNPYGPQDPYGQTPYGQPQAPYGQQTPYGQAQTPYGQTQAPYGQQTSYGQPQTPYTYDSQPQNPYGSQQDPVTRQQSPYTYGGQSQSPYTPPQDPYAQGSPFGQNPYGSSSDDDFLNP